MSAHLRRTAVIGKLAPLIVTLVALSLSGCANYIFRQFDIDSGQSLSVDAKQRMVLVTHKGGKSRDRTIVCTEPSPDAISALAARGSAEGSGNLAGQGSGSGKAEFASSESVASIAMRTQTIQLLRDGLFRACEAYMNGAIDQHQYNVILLNIDKLMINLIGVDAIGGTGATPAVAITAGAPGSPPPVIAGGAGTNSVQSEAMANVILAANAHSSLPSLCISLLASGELRLDNPGHRAVLERCDYLLAGATASIVNRPQQVPNRYRMSQPPATTVVIPPPAAAAGKTSDAAPPPGASSAGKADWTPHVYEPGNWQAAVTTAVEGTR